MSETAVENARPGFFGVSVVEAIALLAFLLVLQFVYAATGFAVEVMTIFHRISYIIATALACTWTLRLHDGFSLKYIGVTIVLVAVGIVSIVVLATVDPLIVTVLALVTALLFGVVVHFTESLPNWTNTHTTLMLVVLGTTVMFIAAAPQDVGSLDSIGFGISVLPVIDGVSSRVEIVRDSVTSVVNAPLVAMGGILYVVGRFFE